MLRQICWASFFSLVITTVPVASSALTVEQVPNPRQTNRGWVADTANLLSSDTEAKLNQLISQLEAENGAEIAVVTIPETTPDLTPKQFATSLFNYWAIGKKDRNNGVLFLISRGDRRVEIETGKGIRTILPDSRVSSIIQLTITPRFKNGDFDGGILAGTQAIVANLRTEQHESNLIVDVLMIIGDVLYWLVYVLVVIGGVVLSLVFVGPLVSWMSRLFPGATVGDNSSSSSDTSSSDSSDFGGGSSDGGGAGGDW